MTPNKLHVERCDIQEQHMKETVGRHHTIMVNTGIRRYRFLVGKIAIYPKRLRSLSSLLKTTEQQPS